MPDRLHYQRLKERALGVPHAGRLAELGESRERFRRNPLKQFRPQRGETARYGSLQAPKPSQPRSHFGEMMIFRQAAGEPLTLLRTLQITAALRGAALAHAPQPCPECISGHAPGGTKDEPVRSERPHLGWAPLAHVGHRKASGRVLGVAALLPDGLSHEERAACLAALAKVREIHMGKVGAWRLEPAGAEELRWTLKQAAWVGPARHWATVTPFVFDRYPKDPWGEEAQAVVAGACERIGLSRPASVAMLKISPHAAVPPSFTFPAAPPRPGKPQRFHMHVLLTFAQPVAGPILIGAGRYYGYGLCRPLAD